MLNTSHKIIEKEKREIILFIVKKAWLIHQGEKTIIFQHLLRNEIKQFKISTWLYILMVYSELCAGRTSGTPGLPV